MSFLSKQAVRVLSMRSFSSSAPLQKLANLKFDDKSGIATLELNSPPVNSLSLDLSTAISTSLSELEKSPPKGLVITSALPNILSAGMDINELYKPEKDRFKLYWSTLQDNFVKLYGSSYPTAAVLNGHAAAGAALLALACEYRVMLPNLAIGLNEARLGIIVPDWCQAMYLNAISRREAEKAMCSGHMFTTDEALKIGLIDEITSDKQDAEKRCEKFLMKFAKMAPEGRAMTKKILRSPEIERLEKNRQEDFDQFWNLLTLPRVQKNIEMFMQSVKAKKST